jgi:hypothetical protein
MDDSSDFVPQDACKRVYLVTYSKADLVRFPTRESFAAVLEDHFSRSKNNNSNVKVEYLAVCREKHEDNSDHYHASVKLTGTKKWNGVKKSIYESHKIVLNFGTDVAGYLKAFRYVNKEDTDVYLSQNHPKDLINAASPKTSKCMAGNKNRRRSSSSSITSPVLSTHQSSSSTSTSSGEASSTPAKPPPKSPRLSLVNVSDMIFSNKVKTLNQLYVLAQERKDAQQTDLANFVLAKDDKQLTELIRKTYLLKEAKNLVEREELSRFDVLSKAAEKDCPDGEWLECAKEVLALNNIHPLIFATAIRDLLLQGRGKYRNLFIIGEANCAKTFMLKPLETIYKCFLNPAKDKYAWVGVEESEVILLQDYRWDPETIAWKNFLLLLEGETVKLPAPKNHFNRDILVNSDIPIFATGKEMIKYVGRQNASDSVEDDMMRCRWKVFKFTHAFSEEEQKHVPPCGACFSKLVLMGHEMGH